MTLLGDLQRLVKEKEMATNQELFDYLTAWVRTKGACGVQKMDTKGFSSSYRPLVPGKPYRDSTGTPLTEEELRKALGLDSEFTRMRVFPGEMNNLNLAPGLYEIRKVEEKRLPIADIAIKALVLGAKGGPSRSLKGRKLWEIDRATQSYTLGIARALDAFALTSEQRVMAESVWNLGKP